LDERSVHRARAALGTRKRHRLDRTAGSVDREEIRFRRNAPEVAVRCLNQWQQAARRRRLVQVQELAKRAIEADFENSSPAVDTPAIRAAVKLPIRPLDQLRLRSVAVQQRRTRC